MDVKNIKTAQDLMRKLYFVKDQKRGVEKTILRLVEELGELSEAVLFGDQNKISGEIVDIIAWALSLANLYEIDIDEAFDLKYNNVCPDCKECPCNCKSI